jgi:hypothetical protein
MKLLLLLLSILLLPIHSAIAIDVGTSTGSLKAGGKDIALKHSVAYQLDNAEGLLDAPRELRIVLSDREVPQDALAGIAFPPVTQMAREGKVQGLLLRLDPADRKKVYVTLLAAPADPRMSLTTLTLSGSQDAFKKLDLANNRAIGEIAHRETRAGSADMPALDFAIQFSAPLFNNPAVTADLRGEAARKSPQAQLLRAKARALAAADFDALKKLSTERQNKGTDEFLAKAGPKAKGFAKEAAIAIEQSLKTLERVVVRGDRAVAIVGKGEWMTFVRVSGQWLTDD